jgi:hypothetical protein
MVEKWNKSGDVPRIERDMALEELRRIYDELLDYTPQQSEIQSVDVVMTATAEAVAVDDKLDGDYSEADDANEAAEAPAVVVSHDDVGEAFDDALDIDALLGLSGDDAIDSAASTASAESAVEPVDVTAEEVEVVAETQPAEEEQLVEESEPAEVAEPVVDAEPAEVAQPVVKEQPVVETQHQVESVGGGLFDIDDIPVQSKSGRKMISVYDTPKRVAQQPAEQPALDGETLVAPRESFVAPQVVDVKPEEPTRLGDLLSKGSVTVLGEKMAMEEQPTAVYNKISDIRKAIGLNDKFLMIRDLFDGDAARYEATIDVLNEFDDLDDCMIYIVENFRWNPDSEGAKLLVSLIERKLS